MKFYIISIAFGQSLQQVAGHPDFVPGLLGSLGEQLELPLSRGHLLVDTFKIDSGGQTLVRMLLDQIPAPSIFSTYGTIVESLWARVSSHREAQGQLGGGIHDKILLFEAEPKFLILIVDGGPGIARMGSPIRVQNLGH